MDIPKKKEKFLKKIDQSRREQKLYKKVNQPLVRSLFRLFRYGPRYLNYLSEKLGLYAGRDVEIETFWGCNLRIPLEDVSYLPLSHFGLLTGNEFKLSKFLIRQLEKDDIFFDVGANYGFYTQLANEFISIPEGELHAFEPDPNTFRYLVHNAANSDCILNQLALAEQDGKITFFNLLGGKYRSSGRNTMVEELVNQRYSGEYEKITVDSLTLDQYAEKNAKPTIIKIDVEGGEESVIKGGENLLLENDIILTMEVWPGESGKKYSDKAVDLIRELGYTSYQIDSGGMIHPVSGTLSRLVAGDFDNFVFKKR